MKTINSKKSLFAICIVFGIVAIIATGRQPKPETGEFVFFSVEKSSYCLNQDLPPFIVRVNFRANSSSNQCVDIKVGDEFVAFTNVQRIKCGIGEWTDSYTFNLLSIFGSVTNIPPTITVTGYLQRETAPTVTRKLFDTATATITTSTNCSPPPPPGITIGN